MSSDAHPLRLFAVMVGGDHPRASIELHDVQFVVARTIRETFPILRERWWGTPRSLHLDAYAEITRVDGFEITPMPLEALPPQQHSLFFVNTGGYLAGVFGEEHRYSFHVGADKREIWQAAKSRVSFGSVHKDNFETIDQILSIDEHLAHQRFGLAFTPAAGPDLMRIVAQYDKMEDR